MIAQYYEEQTRTQIRETKKSSRSVSTVSIYCKSNHQVNNHPQTGHDQHGTGTVDSH
jgi:hypothetical protein